MITLLIATRNAHKVAEIRAILGDTFRCLTLNDFPTAPPVTEDAPTFAGNATKKAIELARWLSSPRNTHLSSTAAAKEEPATRITFTLADDSGLEVDALNGAPGVHSARFAALNTGAPGNSSDADNIAKLLRLLKDVPPEKRTARFRCVVALTPILPDQKKNASPVCSADEFELQTELFEGACEGRITLAPRGCDGFGYDPLFIPDGCNQTFAELAEKTKNQMSHRAKALAKLKQRLDPRKSPTSET